MASTELKTATLTGTSTEDVMTELDFVLASDLFSRSPVLSSFLKFIVTETLENRTAGLKEYTIGVSALGKPSDFNPQLDAIVRIHAGRLRRLLKEYYSGIGKTDPIIIEVIKGSYVPVFRTNGYTETHPEESEEHETFQYSRTKLTLAILPFRNLCPNREYQFFADGFGEELTRSFSHFQDIAVVAHHSTRKYVNAPDDVRSIGAVLGVHYLIDGSVKRTKEEIRVNVGLIETIHGIQLWSKTFNYPLNIDNLTSIQDQIIENVCGLLGGYYGFIVHDNIKSYREEVPSLTSFDATLWNYYWHMNFSKESFTETLKALKVALKHDPNHAACLAMLSELYLDSYTLGYPTVDDPIREGYELAKRAISIDPKCQHAHQQFAWAKIFMKNKEEAIEAMESCLALNPSSVSSLGAIGFGMACASEYERADELLQQSLSLNPHCPWWFYFGFFLVQYHSGNYQNALAYANKIDAQDVFLGPLARTVANYKVGKITEALDESNLLVHTFPQIASNLRTYLDSFLLDTLLVNEMVEVFKSAKARAV
jgi:TolB-like protein